MGEEDLVFTLFTADTALETLMVIDVWKLMLQNARASPNALFVLGLGFLAHKTTFLSEKLFLMYWKIYILIYVYVTKQINAQLNVNYHFQAWIFFQGVWY